jgi:transcriptional regulator with XRE-family HTH domain
MGKRKYFASLGDWLERTGQTPRDAAQTLGVSASYLYYILEGKRKPGRNLISRMARVGINPLAYLHDHIYLPFPGTDMPSGAQVSTAHEHKAESI